MPRLRLFTLHQETNHNLAASPRSMRSDLKMATPVSVLCIFLVLQGTSASEYKKEGLIDKLSSGMKFAQDFLGSESVAQKVAEFVVRAFQTANDATSTRRRPPTTDAYVDESSESQQFQENRPHSDINEAPTPMSPLKHLVRLFGLQPNQISAVAVNALVFVAQMISSFLAGPQRPIQPFRSEDPTTWILNKNSKRLQDIITAAKNESLPDTIEQMIKEEGSEEETSCIRLLVCKITPFVNRMQKAVFGKEQKHETIRGAAIMYHHLPTENEINVRSDICERRHIDCDLNE